LIISDAFYSENFPFNGLEQGCAPIILFFIKIGESYKEYKYLKINQQYSYFKNYKYLNVKFSDFSAFAKIFGP